MVGAIDSAFASFALAPPASAPRLRENEEALRIEMATLGKNHPSVAATRNNMGKSHRKQSKFADALQEYIVLYEG